VIKPGCISFKRSHNLDSRAKTFGALGQAVDKSVAFEGVVISVGGGGRMIGVTVGELPVDGAFIEALLKKVLEKFEPDAPISMTFRKAQFKSGHDLKEFADKLNIELTQEDVVQ
jgi:hypothetical protein